VRKTGVLGILKIFHIAPQRIKESDMVDIIYNMIRDKDPQVFSRSGDTLAAIDALTLQWLGTRSTLLALTD
jgi:vesicle coat complex subunit